MKNFICSRGQLRYFQCFTDYIDECGPMGEHFTRIEFMENSYDIAKDLCNLFSQLHRGRYISLSFFNVLNTVFFIIIYTYIFNGYNFVQKFHVIWIKCVKIFSV